MLLTDILSLPLVLPLQKEFLINRDRAFSWDVTFEEGLSVIEEFYPGKDAVQILKNAAKEYGQQDYGLDGIASIFDQKIPELETYTIKTENQRKPPLKVNKKKDTVSTPAPKKVEDPTAFKLNRTQQKSPRDATPTVEAASSSSSIGDMSAPKTMPIIRIKSEVIVPMETTPAVENRCLNTPPLIPTHQETHMHHYPVPSYLMTGQLTTPQGGFELQHGLGTMSEPLNYSTPKCEIYSTEFRIGAYTVEERKIKIERFRARKRKRVWRKQIKYDCRKRLADTRPRVKGRFVSRKDNNSDDLKDGKFCDDGNGCMDDVATPSSHSEMDQCNGYDNGLNLTPEQIEMLQYSTALNEDDE